MTDNTDALKMTVDDWCVALREESHHEPTSSCELTSLLVTATVDRLESEGHTCPTVVLVNKQIINGWPKQTVIGKVYGLPSDIAIFVPAPEFSRFGLGPLVKTDEEGGNKDIPGQALYDIKDFRGPGRFYRAEPSDFSGIAVGLLSIECRPNPEENDIIEITEGCMNDLNTFLQAWLPE